MRSAGSTPSTSSGFRPRGPANGGLRGYRRPGVGDGIDGGGYYGQGGVAVEEYSGMGGRSAGYIPLLGRDSAQRSPGLAYAAFPTSGSNRNALSTAYTSTLQQQQSAIKTTGMRDRLTGGSSYLEWAPQAYGSTGESSYGSGGAVLYQPVVSSTPASEISSNEPKLTLAQLVNNQLMAARQSYVAQGWRAFQDGEFQTAIRMFSLAENTTLDVPEERAYLKLIMVYGGIAAGQYAQVTNSLLWLLDKEPRTNRFRHVGVFNRIFDDNNIKTIGELYEKPSAGARPANYRNPTYVAQNQAIENLASQEQAASIPKALLAMSYWGRGMRSDAILTAKKIPTADGKIALLGSILEEADRLHKAKEAGNKAREAGRTSPSETVLPGLTEPTATRPSI